MRRGSWVSAAVGGALLVGSPLDARAQELAKAGAGAVSLPVQARLWIPERLVVRGLREAPLPRATDGWFEAAVEIEIAANAAFTLQVDVEASDTMTLEGLEVLDAWGQWQVVRAGYPVIVQRQKSATNGMWVSARLRHPRADPRPLLSKMKIAIARLN